MTHIHVSRRGAVGAITIDRPARFNSLDVTTAQDFRRAGLQCARDPGVRVVVLRGLPAMFCSGADLKFIRDGGDGGEGGDPGYLAPGAMRGGYGERFKQILEYIHSTISEIRRAPKPFIAAVDGVAAVGGFGIAIAAAQHLTGRRRLQADVSQPFGAQALLSRPIAWPSRPGRLGTSASYARSLDRNPLRWATGSSQRWDPILRR